MPRRAARKKRRKREPDPPAIPAQVASHARPVSEKQARWRMRTAKRLVRAIFIKNDPVAVASSLLTSDSDTTKAKSFFDLLGYLYGKPAQMAEADGHDGEKGFQFITYAPRPNHTVDRNSEDQINKEACRQSLTGAPRAARTNLKDVTQEDEND